MFSVFCEDINTCYIAGFNGTILKTTNGGVVGFNEIPDCPSHVTIYPNPTSDKLTISTPIQSHLSILNLNGQELIKQTNLELSTQIDISTLPSGVYIMKLMDEKTLKVEKIIKE